jgi:hypothetical protein
MEESIKHEPEIVDYFSTTVDLSRANSKSFPLIRKMAKLLVVPQEEIDRIDTARIEHLIHHSSEDEFAPIRIEALALANRIPKRKDWFISNFAFEFAAEGHAESVNEMIEHITDPEEKMAALFQCSIAIPPRRIRGEPRIYFPPRFRGGVF